MPARPSRNSRSSEQVPRDLHISQSDHRRHHGDDEPGVDLPTNLPAAQRPCGGRPMLRRAWSSRWIHLVLMDSEARIGSVRTTRHGLQPLADPKLSRREVRESFVDDNQRYQAIGAICGANPLS